MELVKGCLKMPATESQLMSAAVLDGLGTRSLFITETIGGRAKYLKCIQNEREKSPNYGKNGFNGTDRQ